jgi:hypothetical protein
MALRTLTLALLPAAAVAGEIVLATFDGKDVAVLWEVILIFQRSPPGGLPPPPRRGALVPQTPPLYSGWLRRPPPDLPRRIRATLNVFCFKTNFIDPQSTRGWFLEGVLY